MTITVNLDEETALELLMNRLEFWHPNSPNNVCMNRCTKRTSTAGVSTVRTSIRK